MSYERMHNFRWIKEAAGWNSNNIARAWEILWHPYSNLGQRALAYVYLGAGWGTAAVLLAAGTFLFAAGAVEAVAGVGAVAEVACADGDCGNEAAAVAQTAQKATPTFRTFGGINYTNTAFQSMEKKGFPFPGDVQWVIQNIQPKGPDPQGVPNALLYQVPVTTTSGAERTLGVIYDPILNLVYHASLQH